MSWTINFSIKNWVDYGLIGLSGLFLGWLWRMYVGFKITVIKSNY